MVVREKNCYYAIALTDFFVFLSCAEGIPLKAGEVILSGALVPLENVQAGDFMSVSIGGIGNASVLFV